MKRGVGRSRRRRREALSQGLSRLKPSVRYIAGIEANYTYVGYHQSLDQDVQERRRGLLGHPIPDWTLWRWTGDDWRTSVETKTSVGGVGDDVCGCGDAGGAKGAGGRCHRAAVMGMKRGRRVELVEVD